VAVALALKRNRPLGGQEAEFLELYNRISSADPAAFTRVWSDPTAYYWTRLAYEFVGNCLTPGDLSPLAMSCAKARGAVAPRAALTAHLHDFKRFLLALGFVTSTDQTFETPMEVALPFAIPCSRYVLSGRQNVQLHGFVGGKLNLTQNGTPALVPLSGQAQPTPSLEVRESPVAEVGDYQLPIQSEVYNLPGLDVGEPLRLLPTGFQSSQVVLVSQALTLIKRHAADAYAQFQDTIRMIGLKPSNLGNYTNITHSDLPGSFVCTVVNDPYLMADSFIHELYHNRLFFIEELGQFFAREEDNLMTRSNYYSPWREDLRPLHGIFHAVFVFLAVWRFWAAVYRSGETTGMRLAAVQDQILRINLELIIGVVQLRRHAEFTSFGARLFEQMASEVEAVGEEILALGLPHDLPATSCDEDGAISLLRAPDGREITVREAVRSHIAAFDLHHQCDGIDPGCLS
jgi:hypothetical protein